MQIDVPDNLIFPISPLEDGVTSSMIPIGISIDLWLSLRPRRDLNT